MLAWFKHRYLDVVGSIYIYNEHRGYTAIDQVLDAIRQRSPDDIAMIARVEQHRADERKHYLMFRRWFERRGVMPLSVNRSFGHIDRFVEIMFRKHIANLDTRAIVERNELFERLCRVISLTEQRGYRQVEALLSNRMILSDPVLTKIFRIIKADEPSHWAPYEDWLRAHSKHEQRWWERAVDSFIHAELLFVKLPLLFFNPFIKRRTDWVDAAEPVRSQPVPVPAMPAVARACP
jgi:hypothetical protein